MAASTPSSRRPPLFPGSRSTPDAPETAPFLSLLAECGCTLCPEGLVLPARDAPVFLQKLEHRIKTDSSLFSSFISGFQEFISTDANLRKLLTPFACAGQEIGGVDTLSRLLLSIATIQTQVANVLLEKLPEYCADGDACYSGLKESLPKLILSQFRWLDYLVDAESVMHKLMEVLSICPLELQKEIISLIPEIVSDDAHEFIVSTLEQMLQGESQLIASVLDALSNLNLREDLLDQVISLAIASLRSADAEDLPLVVRFLLQSATASNVKRIVHQFRENLHFSAAGVTVKDLKQDKKLKGKAIITNCESLVFEAIRSGLRFQNVMCEAVLKEIRSLDQVQEHRAIDVWLLLIIYANGGPHKKLAESIFKRKAITGLVGRNLLNQSIRGRVALLQDYFLPLLSMSHALLSCKETPARRLGSYAYLLIFEEFTDAYHRQEVLGSLVTHTGSGVNYEVSSALDALVSISSKHSAELLSMSSFINSILDYLECFQDDHLHQVYKVFGQLALASWSCGSEANGSSTANELLIVLRKQISNPDAAYKKMGIIGAVGLISCLGAVTNTDVIPEGIAKKSSFEESFALLHMIMEVCKTSFTVRGLFYDELALLCETISLHPAVLEWISKQTIEFESLFLADLDAGNLPVDLRENSLIEGQVWMNLDGEVSPILLNIQTLLTADDISSSQALVFLPSSFRLLAAVERATNEGSLGNIDALLGCPLYLPKHLIFENEEWMSLSPNLKDIGCISLYYGINWIRELINAYSTQLEGRNDTLTQVSREEISVKLLKRLRNLIYLEHLLEKCMESVPSLCLPLLHSEVDGTTKSPPPRPCVPKSSGVSKKVRKRKALDVDESQNAAASQGDKSSSQISRGKMKQSKISESFVKKTNDTDTQASCQSQETGGGRTTNNVNNEKELSRSDKAAQLEEQRWKFRPLRVQSLSVLSIPQDRSTTACCPDPSAELPLYLYLLRDLDYKLEYLESQNRKQSVCPFLPSTIKPPSGLGSITITEFLKRLEPLFPCLRNHLDTAAKILCEVDVCEDHWNVQSVAAGNPESDSPIASKISTAGSVFSVIICSLSKIFASQDFVSEQYMSTLKEFLSAFQALDSSNQFEQDLQPPPSRESLEYAICGVYSYLDGLFDAAASTSFSVSTELVMAQKGLIACAEACIDLAKESRMRRTGFIQSTTFYPYLKSRLSISAGRVLRHAWEDDGQGKSIKNRGDVLQQLLHIFLQYSESPMELLEELASVVMPQVPAKAKTGDGVCGYPTLSPGTFFVWYRVQHEELSSIFSEVIKDITNLHKSKNAEEDVINLAIVRAQQCAKVIVSLVNLTKIHPDKTSVHSVAVKYGGKFIDTFLKGFDFWQAHYKTHTEAINALVKELQKATRTIQTLCSEAKGLKKMPVTSKIPAVKRSLERYVFYIKALLHSVSQGNSFWMGNLKHKNLQGEEVGSQLPASDDDDGEELASGPEEDPEEDKQDGNGNESDGHSSEEI